MRTKYAIIDTDQALEAGLDISILRAIEDGKKVIITEAQAEGIENVELLDKNEIMNLINNK